MESFEEWSPGLEAMDRGRAVEFRCERELNLEDFELRRKVWFGNPAVEAALTDPSAREACEVAFKKGKPIRGSVLHSPGMKAKRRGNEIRMALGQFRHGGPVVRVGAIDDAVDDSGFLHLGDDLLPLVFEARVGEMIMGVDQHEWYRAMRSEAAFSKSSNEQLGRSMLCSGTG